MSIIENAETRRHKAKSAVAAARLSGYKLISQARTEKARATARALSGNGKNTPANRTTAAKAAKAQERVPTAQERVSRAQGGVIRGAGKKVA